jgi:WD40 repeat protein
MVSFSSDGKILATTGADGEIRLWEVRTGTELRQMHTGAQDLASLAFVRGDKLLVSGGYDQAVQLWEVATGKELPRFGGETRGRCALSPDGSKLVSWSGQASRLWSVNTGKALLPLMGHQASVRAAALADDGRTVISVEVAAEYGLRLGIWESGTGSRFRPTGDWQDKGRLLAFVPDRKTLAVAKSHAEDPRIRLYDLAPGKQVRELMHPAGVTALALSADGKVLASASGNWFGEEDPKATIHMWEIPSGREMRRLIGHKTTIFALQFSPDGRVLASASWDRTMRVWSTTTGKELRRLEGHSDGLRTVAFSPDGRLLASASQDGTVRLWELATGGEVWQIKAWATVLAFAPDGKTLASVNGLGWNNIEPDNILRLWDVMTWLLSMAFATRQVRRFLSAPRRLPSRHGTPEPVYSFRIRF